MKRKMYVAIVLLLTSLCLTGCYETKVVSVNVENGSELNSNLLGMQSFVEIGSDLFYDAATGIVYMQYGYGNAYDSKKYCPYYAPNGLPYKYNPESNTLEMISCSCSCD